MHTRPTLSKKVKELVQTWYVMTSSSLAQFTHLVAYQVISCSPSKGDQGERVNHPQGGELDSSDGISTSGHRDQVTIEISEVQTPSESFLPPSSPGPANEEPDCSATSAEILLSPNEDLCSYVPESDSTSLNLLLACNHSAAPVPKLSCDPTSFLPSLEPAAAIPEVNIPALFIEVIDDATALEIATAMPQSVLEPKAAIIIPEIPAVTPNPVVSILDVVDVSPARSLQASIHAPTIRPRDYISNKSKARSLQTSIHAPTRTSVPVPDVFKTRALKASIHAPNSRKSISVLDTSKARSLQTSIHAPARTFVPVPDTFKARPPQASIHAPIPRRPISIPRASKASSLQASIHAPAPQPSVTISTNNKARSLQAPIHAPVPQTLKASIHAPASRPAFSGSKISCMPENRSLGSSIHAPAPVINGASEGRSQKVPTHAPPPRPAPSGMTASEARSLRSSIHAPTLDIDEESEARSLRSSIHAPAPRPAPRASESHKHLPTLKPAAQGFLPGARSSSTRNYGQGVAIIPSPKKRRVRSSHIKEGKRLESRG
ncbi:hypothetical protein BDZ94DRAFT_969841 [Collybia nuda]|uniref:Uncharacterized protein n=1 Tax=Collybia nuda TaxID=64659 RepID=A0A9P5YEW8_9AGAR|nr:hypothetical protein BDZ94DRAFT_969841 [Collybia nuda]